MCAYNAEKYIYDAIHSCYTSDEDSLFELIIVDDCSSDNTNKIIQDYIEKECRKILVIKNNTNIGLTKSLNIAIDYVKTDLMARLDADDQNAYQRIKRQVEVMEKDQSLFCCSSDAFLINDNGDLCKKTKFPKIKSNISDYLLNYGNPFIHSSLMFRVEKLIEIGKYSPEFSFRQDYELLIRSLKYNLKIKHLNKPLIHHRVSSISISSNSSALIYGELIRFYMFTQKQSLDKSLSFNSVKKKYFKNRSLLMEEVLLNERRISVLKNNFISKSRFGYLNNFLFELLIRAILYFLVYPFKPYLVKLLRKKLNH